MNGLQSTYQAITAPRADFHRPDFEILIQQKGRNVIVEKSIQCPCRSNSINQQSNCKNCGGSGWLYINPKTTRLILKAMNITPDFKAWSEEIRGDLQVTASDTEELCFMDKITVLDAKGIFNEVLTFKTKGPDVFAYAAYNINKVLYAGYFAGVGVPLTKLTEGTDYTINGQIVKLINSALVDVQGEKSVTFRYEHPPVYYIVDMKRESMESFELAGTEKLIHLPVSGTARRWHYNTQAQNLTGDRLLNNSYTTSTCQ